MSSYVSHVTRTTLSTEPAAPPSLFPQAGPTRRLSVADAGRRSADQVGDVGMRGRIVGAQVAGREPAVLVGGGLLPLVQAIEAHLGRSDQDGVEGLVLDDAMTAPGELDRVLRDGLTELRRVDRDAGLLVQLPDGRVAQGLPALGRAADGEPEGVIGMMRIPAVQ